jgi:hypothetical protein
LRTNSYQLSVVSNYKTISIQLLRTLSLKGIHRCPNLRSDRHAKVFSVKFPVRMMKSTQFSLKIDLCGWYQRLLASLSAFFRLSRPTLDSRMLFITNRVLNEGPTPTSNDDFLLPRSVSFNFNNNQAEQSIYFCRRNGKDSYIEIGGLEFLSELRDSDVKEILIYVHGFSSLPEPAIFPRAAELQRLFDQKEKGKILVVPIIWPCDSKDSQIKDYFDDQMAADQSGVAFARMIQKFLKWQESNADHLCTKRINVLAHSMGNRVLRATFAKNCQYFLPQGMPLVFRNIFMAAPDIVNEALEPDQEGQFIPNAARNVVVYYAADDLAMRASKVANLGNRIASRRMGHTGPEHMDRVSKNVYALDCDDFNKDYDRQAGHSYFASDPEGNAGILFNHMWRCIQTGRVPMEPLTARSAILNRDWLG